MGSRMSWRLWVFFFFFFELVSSFITNTGYVSYISSVCRKRATVNMKMPLLNAHIAAILYRNVLCLVVCECIMDLCLFVLTGFVDLQTEKSDLIDNVGAIPFLDYKHFASKIFFPEAGPLAALLIRDIGQDSEQTTIDEKCQAFAALIRDKQFLSCFVHALEEQKNFSIRDKCTVASLLTLALHGDLLYLTEVMEDLLQSLMDQSSNTNPKLLLRRTESIVEKLLTNWMSICLYGFLRESVGQPLFLLVSALTQQISKGPVDSVTEKALYTLSEDWLLCQAQDFEALVSSFSFTLSFMQMRKCLQKQTVMESTNFRNTFL
ncbi:plexin-C1-like [Cyprinus carpio]|uniref:Plexin-C1-like n=1 Tax=Cyprinus carpio TaxID=7962 RepID=A0A9Q9W730_CYPCA|nr:plexin-C1-like [Cyprinus carpio]